MHICESTKLWTLVFYPIQSNETSSGFLGFMLSEAMNVDCM